MQFLENDGNIAIDSRIIHVQKEDNESTEEENGFMPPILCIKILLLVIHRLGL